MRQKSRESFDAQRTASSGKRIERPSDDPVGVHRVNLLRAMKSDLDTAQRKMEQVNIQLRTAEEALDGMGSIISRLRELGVQMATALSGPAERENASVEVFALHESLIALANSRHGDKRLFAGQQTDASAFDSDGIYLGDSTAQSVQVAEGTTIEVTFAGDEVMRGAAGDIDILASVENFAEALAVNDVGAIQDALGDLDLSQQHLLDYRSQVGSRMALTNSLAAHFEMVEVSLLQDISTVEDADPLEAFSEVIRTQQAFQSAMQVSVASRNQSIFDLL